MKLGKTWKLILLAGAIGLVAPSILIYEAWLNVNNLMNEPAFVWNIPYFFPGYILTFADPFPPNFWGIIIFSVAVGTNVVLYAIIGFLLLRVYLLMERLFGAND